MIKSLHVSLGICFRLAAVTWNGFLFLKLSHMCVLLLPVLVSDEREFVSGIGVWSFKR